MVKICIFIYLHKYFKILILIWEDTIKKIKGEIYIIILTLCLFYKKIKKKTLLQKQIKKKII